MTKFAHTAAIPQQPMHEMWGSDIAQLWSREKPIKTAIELFTEVSDVPYLLKRIPIGSWIIPRMLVNFQV